ncbi:MAG: DNA polymerase III subunit alpha [Deltaproteobacteria bacterium]|nr:DNA polymerase III subunit alpha [Deltaproteobacteria bacterium]
MTQFVHLHLHTQYSLLDGANKIPDVLQRAHELGQPAIAMTDHGNMHGAVEFYRAGQKIGIKPIIGCELYLNPVSRFEKKTKHQGGAPTHHLTVLAKNNIGYHNLCRLSSLAYKEGFYFKPRIDYQILEEYSEGLVVLSGCVSGELAYWVELDDMARARSRLESLARIFKDDLYLEVQPHQDRLQQKVNQACLLFSKELGLPLVATTDCHYMDKDDHFAREVLMCISTGRLISDPERMRYDGFDLHLKSADEMREEFGEWPGAEEAIEQTLKIAEKCEIQFDFSTYHMPNYDLPPGRSAEEEMAEKARAGLEQRWSLILQSQPDKPPHKAAYQERLEEEILQISQMGFASYFLVVADFINWAKNQGIPVGPGRGSAAGSLVAYAMAITEIDPIRHKLLFERFLNPARVSMPDIDVDFCIFGRDKVINYVVQKYGSEKVAQIATFGTLKAKAAIKDVGRVLGIPYAETDRVAQLVPAPRQGFDCPLAEALTKEKRLAEYARGEGGQLIQLALKLEGLTRHSSTHAAGVVIGDRPLIEMLPVMTDKDGNDVTQFSMDEVARIGLVKFDFLGLKTLTVIRTTIEIVHQSRGLQVDLDTLPLSDPSTYAMLCAGNTTGVFQLESTGITETTVRLRPNCFDDLVAIVALYRPGPLDAGMVDHYIERKHGREPVSYLHPSMRTVLQDTYGIIIYQEQIMQLARELAGYSPGEADLLRRAMGKKVPQEMADQRKRFLSGAIARGLSKKVASEVFDQMETFGRYGFNRSHSAAYALIAYQTAYLKAHYGVEFMAALLSHEMDDSDKTLKNLNECRKQKIEVLPPDVNVGQPEFSVNEGKIRYGLSAVKGVGEKAVVAIVAAREQDGPFDSLEDFVARVDLHAVNRRVVESLIKCGAFDSCGSSRRDLYERVEEVMRAGQALQREQASNQIGLFGDSFQMCCLPKRLSQKPEWPINQKLSMEREALGFYISGHPLQKYKSALVRLGVTTTLDLRAYAGESDIKVGGVVTALKLRNTKKGQRYASFVLEDWCGTVEAIAWPDVYSQYVQILTCEDPIVATGRLDLSAERCVLIISKIEALLEMRDRSATQGVMVFGGDDRFEDHVDELVEVLRRHAGNCPIKVYLRLDGQEISLALKGQDNVPVCVLPSEELCDQVEQLFGKPVLSFI